MGNTRVFFFSFYFFSENDAEKRKRSYDGGDVTEGEQDSLPNDQQASPVTIHATVSDKKNGWRSSKAKELEDSAVIPRIRISSDEPNDGLLHPDDDNS